MSSESDERGGRAGRRRRLPRSWRKGALRGGSSHVIRGKATQRHTEPEARLETRWAQCMRHARARLKKARAPIAKSTSVLRETIVVLVLWPPHRSLAHPECWNSHARPASESSSYMARTHLECEPRRRCRRTRRARRHRRGRNHRRRAGIGTEVHLPTSIAFCGCSVGTLAPMRMKPCISLCASTALTLSE